jgi:hypothetical protein
MGMITGPFDFDLRRMMRRGKGRTSGPIRILAEALVLADVIGTNEIEAGRISSPDYYSPEIQRYEKSALGSSRII